MLTIFCGDTYDTSLAIYIYRLYIDYFIVTLINKILFKL